MSEKNPPPPKLLYDEIFKFHLLLLTTAESLKISICYILLEILTCGNSQDHLKKTAAFYSTYSIQSGQMQRNKERTVLANTLRDYIEFWMLFSRHCVMFGCSEEYTKSRFKEGYLYNVL